MIWNKEIDKLLEEKYNLTKDWTYLYNWTPEESEEFWRIELQLQEEIKKYCK